MTARVSLLLTLLVVVAGCGRETNVRERDLLVRGSATAAAREAPDRETRGVRIATARIVFITHGQASDEFWKVVQRGEEEAHKQTGAAVSYRSPDAFSIERMRRYIDLAVADHPDGMVISLPDAKALSPSIKAAVKAGIPVITINSGSDEFKRLGVLAHVGQDEYRAGVEAGRRMGKAGVKHALCVNQENGNTGLDQRCRGLADGLAKTGGTMKPLPVPLQDATAAQTRMAEALASGPVDGVVTLGPGGAKPALDAIRASGLESKVTLATFDLSPEVLAAVRDGKMLFAVDQQPYLQGYLPVMLLAEKVRYGVFPNEGKLISTGPKFITKADAADVIRLSAEGVR
ncbi:MAG TPA: sugar ABC transporter substrate-binding protein [Solirubrobacter sp.]